MRTFKELQDDVLLWAGDSGDTGTLRNVVKDAIKRAHQTLLTEQMYDFMLWPQQETLAIEGGRRDYVLHPLYMQGLWFYNTTTNEFMEEVPVKGTLEIGSNPHDASAGAVNQFMLTSVVPVARQPVLGSQLTINATGGSESSSNSVTVSGINSDGEYVEETASSTTAWTALGPTTFWKTITGVTKNGTTWTRGFEIDDQTGVALLSLQASERGKQYRQFELVGEPSGANTVIYRFYQKPRILVNDYDPVQVPEEFDQILVLRALIGIAGYTRPTKDELFNWQTDVNKLEFNMKSTYTQTRTLGGRPHYVNYRER